ncbi:MAG: DUF1700 domain-containing protein [Provencibacterium sp.]|jgi:hypothetical protein|nr:DUF1700 domain-containing protein [Provencibacterium sp.]
MTRVEYIRQLEFSLSGRLPQREVSEILRDYSEYFEAGKSEGKTEEEISISLGIPSAAAAQILSEIEEEKGYRRKMPEPGEPKKEAPDEKGNMRRLKELVESLFRFLGGLFDKIEAGIKSAFPSGKKAPGAQPESEKAAGQENVPKNSPPKDAYPPKRPSFKGESFVFAHQKRGSPRLLLSVLLALLLFPVILLAILFGGGLLALLCFGIILLIFFMVCLFLFFLAAAFAGSIGFAVAGGLGLPMGFMLLFIVGLLFCLAGSVLSVCGLCYLIKGLARLIRFCLGSRNWGKAKAAASETHTPNVYQDGWNAPTPPPAPAPEEPPLSPYDSSAYASIYEEPIPEPRLQFGEQPEETEENREENGHA